MGVDHPGDIHQELANLRREVRRLARMTMQNAAIGRAGLRVYDGGVITIENGGLDVTGTANVVGVLTGNGQFIWTGPVTISGATAITGATDITGDLDVTGPTEITGPLSIEGATDITGNTDITGDVTLTGDLDVVSTGRVKVGNMTLDPSASGGKVKFSGGPEVYATGGMLGIYSTGSGAWIELDSSGARLNFGVRSVIVTSTGVQLVGLPTRTSALANGAAVGTVWSDTSGNLYRVIA